MIKKNIVISGSTGYIGGMVIKKLGNKFNFICINRKKNESNKNYLWSELEKINWEKIDCIIHLTGIAHDFSRKFDEDDYEKVNVNLTKKIYGFYIKHKIKKFIFFSSVKAVCDNTYNFILNEETKCDPKTIYGKSKLRAEQVLLNNSLLNNKQTIVVLRPCVIFGKNSKGNIKTLISYVKANLPWFFLNFKTKKSFLFIENLLFLLEKIINNKVSSGIYNIADDSIINLNDLISFIKKKSKTKNLLFKINKKSVICLMSFLKKLNFLNFLNKIEKLTSNYVVSNKKIKEELKIKKLPFSTYDGINKII